MNDKTVIIIGAGWNGVGVAASLAQNGINDFIVLEQTETCGGFWKHHTYDSVRMHTPGRLYKSPEHLEVKDFLTREDVPLYLTGYAEHFGVLDRVRFNFEVKQVSFNEDECWTVRGVSTVDGSEEVFVCEYLCIATSYCRIPFVPEQLKGGYEVFGGKIIHSDEYKNPLTMTGTKKILIIGGGHSSSEIATELAESGYDISISHRSGQYFMNEEDWTPFLGTQNLEESLKYWGYNMNDSEYSLILDHFDKKFATMLRNDLNEKLNWRIPDMPPARFIILNKKTFIDESTFLKQIQDGTVGVRGSVDTITVDGVRYTTGENELFDGIILTTGFRPDLHDFLDNSDIYLSSSRHHHLDSESFTLPITDGRSKSTIGKNLFFPGFDYGITQRVEFGLHAWYTGEQIAQDLLGIDPELSPEKFKRDISELLQ